VSDAPAFLPRTDRLGAPWCRGVSSAIGAGPAGLSDLHLLGRLGKGQGRLAPNIQSDTSASLPHTDRLGAPWCRGVSSAIGAGPAGLSDLLLLGKLGKG